MISNTYKMQLENEAKQLDTLLGQDRKFECLVCEITQEQGGRASLELINELGMLVKKSALPKIKERQEKLVELLYKYLGSKEIEVLYQTLKETSSIPLEDLLKELYALVGLDQVKQQVQNLIGFNKIQKLRVENGLNNPMDLYILPIIRATEVLPVPGLPRKAICMVLADFLRPYTLEACVFTARAAPPPP